MKFASSFSRSSFVSLLALLGLALGAAAGSLTPSASPAPTMHTLQELYDSLVGTFDSSSTTSNVDGNVLENLKYIESNLGWASSSNDIFNVNTGNVGIGTSTPMTLLDVAGNASVSGDFEIGGTLVGPVTIISKGNLALNATVVTSQTSATTYGVFGFAYQTHDVGLISNVIAVEGDAYNAGAGNATRVIGASGYAEQDGSGTTDTMASLYAFTNVRTGGTVTNNYGVYIENQTAGSTNWGLYSAGANDNYFGGNVGIKTTSVDADFEVRGTASVSALLINGSSPLSASVSSNLTPSVDNTYNLGSPTLRWKSLYLGPGSLHISSTTGTSGAGSNYTDGSLSFTGSSLSFSALPIGSGASGSITFSTGTNKNLHLASTGNVGVGTTAPGATLAVTGTASVSSNFAVNSNKFYVNAANGNVGIGTKNFNSNIALEVVGTASASGQIRAQGGSATLGAFTAFPSTANPYSFLTYRHDSTSTTAFSLQINTSDDTLVSTNNGHFIMSLSGANFGINDTAPSYKLSVNGTASISSTIYAGGGDGSSGTYAAFTAFPTTARPRTFAAYRLDSTSTPSLTAQVDSSGNTDFSTNSGNFTLSVNSGNVGINATTPEQKLNVGGSIIASASGNVDLILNTTSAGASQGKFTIRSGSGGTASESLQFLNNTTALVTIASTGNVGIGTTTPAKLLEIHSTADTDILRLSDSDGTCDHNPESGAETVTCSSDARLKTDIVDAPSALQYLSDFHIRQYTVRASGDRLIGVIAQELQLAHPELVSSGSSGYLSVQQPNSWVLLKGIQELASRTYSLEQLMGAQGGLAGQVDESSLFDRFIAYISDIVLRVRGIIADTVTSRDGVTTYDEDTGDPYCIKVKGGSITTEPGVCGDTQVHSGTSGGSSDEISPPASSSSSDGAGGASDSSEIVGDTGDTPTPTEPIESVTPTPSDTPTPEPAPTESPTE